MRHSTLSLKLFLPILLLISTAVSLEAQTITLGPTSWINFSTSTRVQSYTVSGSSLGSNNIVITPPSNYLISLQQNTGYTSSITLNQSGGTVASTTIYVRLTGTSTGTYSGNITHVAGGTTVTKAVYGRVVVRPAETYLQGTTVQINQGNGNGVSDLPLPSSFNWQYGGTAYTTFDVSANGYVGFGNTNVNIKNNTCITNSSPDAIFAFWDATRIDTSNCASVLYGTFGSSPNRKFVIQYTNVLFDGTTSPLGTVQIILYESNKAFQLQYRTLIQRDKSLGQFATVGVKVSNTKMYPYSCDQGKVFEGLALLYTPDGSGGYTLDSTASYDGVLLGRDANAPPTVPDVEAPDSYTTVSQLTRFWWKASTSFSATEPSYRLIISTNSDLTSPHLDTTITDTSFRISTLKQLTGGTTYYWSIITCLLYTSPSPRDRG